MNGAWLEHLKEKVPSDIEFDIEGVDNEERKIVWYLDPWSGCILVTGDIEKRNELLDVQMDESDDLLDDEIAIILELAEKRFEQLRNKGMVKI